MSKHPNTPNPTRRRARRVRRLLLTAATLMTVTLPSVASAVPARPVWDVDQVVYPTIVVPGAEATISVALDNIGAAPSSGPVSMTVDLPSGMTFLSREGDFRWSCSSAPGASTVTCTHFAAVLAHTPTVSPLALRVAVAAGTTSLGPIRARANGGGAGAPATDDTIPQLGAGDGPFGIAGFIGKAINLDGTPAREAGGHPDVTTVLTFPTSAAGYAIGNVRDIDVELPAGLVGNPQAVPTCPYELLDVAGIGSQCPTETQVGIVYFITGGIPLMGAGPSQVALYNMEAPVGLPARFAFNSSGTIVNIDPVVRTGGDYGITARVAKTSQSLAVVGTKVTLWGVPADPAHDDQRLGGFAGGTRTPPASSSVPPVPFITAPTECSGKPLTTRIATNSWERPDEFRTATFDTNFDGSPLTVEGCDKLPFTPTVVATPTSSQPDAPTGLNVQIDSPQNLENPNGLASAQLRDVTVTLPEGMTINPGAADGLGACTDAQLGLTTADEPSCPDSAKIGTVTARSPLLREEFSGGVYIRSQASSDPESGEMFRMAIVLENKERGILVKLPGSIRVNKDTGRIVTEFKNNPQLPVEQIKLSLKSGQRSPLATPPTCGAKSIDTELTSWAGQDVKTRATFTVACTGGLGAFSPTFKAGTTNPVGGAFTPFALNITKPDGNAPISGLSMKLPTGLLAQLKGNIGTQVGTVTAFAGPGSNPFALPGQVYLEGAYGDAPFSLRVVVPAKAGPFDLGTVEVKQKIYVDPITAQVTVVSDPLPTIVKGVPVRLQRLDVNVDKAGFIINPTSCAPKAFTGTMSAVDGQTAPINVRFQVGSCASLGYTPKLAMTMSGKGQTKDGSHPALSARLTPPAGDANNKKVTVTLPLSLALDPGNANGLCEPADAAKNQCAANTVVGSAQAQSILPDTLKAPVYFVRGERIDSKGKVRKTLPKLFIPLSANGVTVYVTGDSDVQGDRLVTTFDNLPDAPFSTFDLTINGGKHGILAVSNTNTCAVTNVADARYAGQNGKAYTSKVTMGTPCALGVVKSSRTATALKLTIGGVGAGKLSATGNGVAKASTTIASATTATLSLKLAKATRRALARGRDVKVKVKVAFTAKGQKKAKTATKTVTIHGTKKR